MSDKLNILIVDDTKPIRILLLKKLEKDYNCILAESPPGAIKILEEFEYNVALIITDYEMPKMNGYEFLKAIRPKAKHIPVIMLSSALNEDRIRELFNLGVKKFIAKPVNLNRLLEEMKKLLKIE